jgi:hypothetical protein
MKKLTWISTVIGIVAIVAVVAMWRLGNPPPSDQAAARPAQTPARIAPPPAETAEARAGASEPAEESPSSEASASEPGDTPNTTSPTSAKVPATPPAKPSFAADISQLLQTLVSPQATYAQKQAAWKQLRDDGKLDEAIAELERAAKTDPSAAVYSAALGQAYLQKLETTQDTRDQAILAMKADQTFDQALNADPNNWDARFYKASALSHWPAELNKSQDVIENFSTLIEQQETQPPQPQFAQSYLRLGEQYQKSGYADLALEMWQRGAALFPSDQALQAKLAQPKN